MSQPQSQSQGVVALGESPSRASQSSLHAEEEEHVDGSPGQIFTDMDYPRTLREEMLSSLETGLFSDIEIECSGKTFKLHKNILAMTCPYFRTMFTSKFKESAQSKVTLEDIDPDALRDVLTYLYSGGLKIIDSNAVEVAKLADMFELFSLHEFCCNFLTHRISFDTCLGLMKLGRSLNSIKLEKAATRYALKYFSSVAQVPEFLQMEKEELCNYVKQPALKVGKEEEVLGHVFRWLRENPNERISGFCDVLCSLHLLDIDLSRIKYNLMKIPALRNNPEVSQLVNQIQDHVIAKYPAPAALQVLNPRLQTKTRQGVMFFLELKKVIPGGVNTLPLHICMTFRDTTNLQKQNFSSSALQMNMNAPPGISCCVVGSGTIYVSGVGDEHDRCFRFEVNLAQWQECARMPHGRREHRLITGTDNKLYAVGGINYNGGDSSVCEVAKEILEYDITTNVWCKCGQLQKAVYHCGALFIRGDVFVFGGMCDPLPHGANAFLGKIQKFDTFSKECTVLKVKLPIASPIKQVFLPRENLIIVTEKKIVGVSLEELESADNEEDIEFHETAHNFGTHFTGSILGRRLVVINRKGLLYTLKWERLFDNADDVPDKADILGKVTHDPDTVTCCDAVLVNVRAAAKQGPVCYDPDD